jgi:hypothetical protein
MKEIVLKQYIEVRRVVAVTVPDDCTEEEAAKMLDDASLDNDKLEAGMKVVDPWCYINDRGIENESGETVMYGDDEEWGHG